MEESRGPHDIFQDIKRLHEACQKYGVRTVALSIPDFWRDQQHVQRITWLSVNEKLKEWACGLASSRTHFVDSVQLLPYSKVTLARGFWEADGIHFSESGSQEFGSALASQLLPLMLADRPGMVSEAHCPQAAAGVEPGEPDVAEQVVKRLLVLGSSVAKGCWAAPGKSWTDRLSAAIQAHGFELRNHSLEDSDTDTWQKWLCDLGDGYLDEYSIVLVSLSISEEELAFCRTPDQFEDVEQKFIEGLQLITFLLRGMMPPGTRIVLCGPYPGHGSSEMHLQSLQRTLRAIRSLEAVDSVVDFLQPILRDGHDGLVDAIASDSGYPNDVGHERMFECIDVVDLLGLA